MTGIAETSTPTVWLDLPGAPPSPGCASARSATWRTTSRCPG